MLKTEFLKKVGETTGLPAATVEKVLEAIGAEMRRAARSKTDLVVPSIGKMTVETRAERTGKNPQTGAPLTTPAKNIVKLRAAKEIRDAAPVVA